MEQHIKAEVCYSTIETQYSQQADNPKLKALKDFSRNARKYHFRLNFTAGHRCLHEQLQAAARFLLYATDIYSHPGDIPEQLRLNESSDLYNDAMNLLTVCPHTD